MGSGPSFDKLNMVNYVEWAMLMEALLVRKSLWEVVSGAETRPVGSVNSKTVKAWQRKNDEARAEIVLNVESSQLPHVRETDAAAVWETLKRIHQARGFGTRLSRRRDFFAMRKEERVPMSQWIADVRRAAFQIEETGGSVVEEDIILVLTNGLGTAYESLIVTLDSTPTDQLNLDYVIDQLLNEESRQGTKPIIEPWASTVAYVADKKPRVPLEKITCYRCGRKGHYKANCPEPEREQNTKDEKAHLAYDDDSFLF